MGLTTDPHDGCLYELDTETGMQKCYLILPDGKRLDLVQPVRRKYVHLKCGVETTMHQSIAETYAANPTFYSATMCMGCKGHFPVGELGEFDWSDEPGHKVGT